MSIARYQVYIYGIPEDANTKQCLFETFSANEVMSAKFGERSFSCPLDETLPKATVRFCGVNFKSDAFLQTVLTSATPFRVKGRQVLISEDAPWEIRFCRFSLFGRCRKPNTACQPYVHLPENDASCADAASRAATGFKQNGSGYQRSRAALSARPPQAATAATATRQSPSAFVADQDHPVSMPTPPPMPPLPSPPASATHAPTELTNSLIHAPAHQPICLKTTELKKSTSLATTDSMGAGLPKRAPPSNVFDLAPAFVKTKISSQTPTPSSLSSATPPPPPPSRGTASEIKPGRKPPSPLNTTVFPLYLYGLAETTTKTHVRASFSSTVPDAIELGDWVYSNPRNKDQTTKLRCCGLNFPSQTPNLNHPEAVHVNGRDVVVSSSPPWEVKLCRFSLFGACQYPKSCKHIHLPPNEETDRLSVSTDDNISTIATSVCSKTSAKQLATNELSRESLFSRIGGTQKLQPNGETQPTLTQVDQAHRQLRQQQTQQLPTARLEPKAANVKDALPGNTAMPKTITPLLDRKPSPLPTPIISSPTLPLTPSTPSEAGFEAKIIKQAFLQTRQLKDKSLKPCTLTVGAHLPSHLTRDFLKAMRQNEQWIGGVTSDGRIEGLVLDSKLRSQLQVAVTTFAAEKLGWDEDWFLEFVPVKKYDGSVELPNCYVVVFGAVPEPTTK